VIEIFDTPNFLYLVMDLIEGGELFDEIITLKTFDERHAAKTVRDILSGLRYLHKVCYVCVCGFFFWFFVVCVYIVMFCVRDSFMLLYFAISYPLVFFFFFVFCFVLYVYLYLFCCCCFCCFFFFFFCRWASYIEI
jgi:Protein kinase domain